MKFVKIILGLVAAGVLLVGGFMAGTFITQTRTANIPAQQFVQPTFIPQQQIQPTIVPQQQFQPTIVPQQPQGTPVPQTTPLAIPPQGQWGRGGWMMDPNYVPQGEWEHGWMMQPNYAPQGQQGWNGMHNGMMNGYGMHGDLLYGWQSNPTPNVSNNSVQTYPTPSISVSFKDNVQPIFAARCVACHGGTNGLFLDTYENVLKGGVNGAVVIPGDVYNSRLAYYVYGGYMPFRSTPLASTEIQTILDWIALGAPNN
jgi:hypothetical protein